MENQKLKTTIVETSPSPTPTVSALEVALGHLICAIGIAISFWLTKYVHFITLISHPSEYLRLIWFFRAVGRGIVGLFAGAMVNAFVAIALGTPIGVKYFSKTINWSMMMSLFTASIIAFLVSQVAPAASAFGSSWTDWQRIFAYTKPVGPIDYMICLPAHGAVIGAWFGAWPMPLDWERPWQEWPICVSYGAIAGYLIGTAASFSFVLARGTLRHTKRD
ncbi:PIGF/3-ketodihydrosphingosine reductase fusion protein isoform X3 [Humulus lupulus]|uniref:PIGF/3-ketodihydrosphingosine reductase fusion protein isoform X3 n=1 Tax=Humulus lupulus TaxID=3486 RepID=UPI002B414A0B|nr:PIGF/3-ketodihydrosphingosine reductase fusion protein isoform X3 [Humulus lupulus]